jgi:hypothetical protein
MITTGFITSPRFRLRVFYSPACILVSVSVQFQIALGPAIPEKEILKLRIEPVSQFQNATPAGSGNIVNCGTGVDLESAADVAEEPPIVYGSHTNSGSSL